MLEAVYAALTGAGINGNWLRTGNGEMSEPPSRARPRAPLGEAFEALLDDGVPAEQAYAAIGRVAIDSPELSGIAAYRAARRLVK
jgi:hypothetical protein